MSSNDLPAFIELRRDYGLTKSGAWAVLRKHNAPRQGRGFAPLSPELREAIRSDPCTLGSTEGCHSTTGEERQLCGHCTTMGAPKYPVTTTGRS